MNFKPEPIRFFWKYPSTHVQVNFMVGLEDEAGDVRLIDVDVEKGPVNGAIDVSTEIPFQDAGKFRLFVFAKKGNEVSDRVFSEEFVWGNTLPRPFDLEIKQP